MVNAVKVLFIMILLSCILYPLEINVVYSSSDKPLYVAIIWHQHQPFYEDLSGRARMPWLRLHAAKDYFKMAWLSQLYPDIHVTIDLTGSLLIQLQDFVNGSCWDQQYIISWKLANGEELSIEDKWSMLQIPSGFFDINWGTIVEEHARYKEILDKRNEAFQLYGGLPPSERMEKITSYLSDQDYLDLAVMFNLYWMNPLVIENMYPDLASLWSMGDYRSSDLGYTPYTREDLVKVLNAHLDQAIKALQIHRELQDSGVIEVVTTPYTHPLSPLLVDLGWRDDLEIHMVKAIEMYKKLFNKTLTGLWSPEQAVNQGSLEIFVKYNISWTVTDPRVAAHADPSFLYSGSPNYDKITRPYYVEFNGSRIYVLFRDWVLSDKVGFTYSKMNPIEAVDDFINTILYVKNIVGGGRILVIALDGENAWDSYPNDALEFLTELYERLSLLQSQGVIKTVTISEYLFEYSGIEEAVEFPESVVEVLDLEDRDLSIYKDYSELPRKSVLQKFPEGSWAGGSLDLWIGELQENIAWMFLKNARDTLYGYVLSNGWSWAEPWTWSLEARDALEYLLRAEGSDWYWGYGVDMSGGYDYVGDILVKLYLRTVYECIGLEPPPYLYTDYYPDGQPYWLATPFREGHGLVSPVVDGFIDSVEWGNSTLYMSVSSIPELYVGCDYENLYIGLLINYTGEYSIVVDIGFEERFIANYLDYLGYSVGFKVSYSILDDRVYKAVGNESWGFLGYVERALSSSVEYRIPYELLGIPDTYTSKIYIRILLINTSNCVIGVAPYDYPGYTTRKISVYGELVFSYNDPIGDDHGPGNYTYPLNQVFVDGVFDLLEYRVYDQSDSIRFVFKFRELGGNPWNAPYGFSLQIIEVYIDAIEGHGATWCSRGSNIVVAREDAWEYALRIAGWSYGNQLWLCDGVIVSNILSFYVDEAGNEIHVILPKSIELANGTVLEINGPYRDWEYVVVVGSQDGYGIDYWRPVAVEAGEWKCGGGDPDAIAVGVEPRVMDMLSPPWTTQEEMLSSYNPLTKSKAVVYGVGYEYIANQTTTTTTPQSTTTTPIAQSSPVETTTTTYLTETCTTTPTTQETLVETTTSTTPSTTTTHSLLPTSTSPQQTSYIESIETTTGIEESRPYNVFVVIAIAIGLATILSYIWFRKTR